MGTLTLLKVNHPKEHMRFNKITQTNYEEEDFRGVEVTVVAEVDLFFVLGVV